MSKTANEFYDVLQMLNDSGVQYVVIGGVAMSLLGANNVTIDIDISFARDRQNTEALASVLAKQHAGYRGFPPDLPVIIDAQTLRNSTNLTLETDLGDFDLLALPEGVDF